MQWAPGPLLIHGNSRCVHCRCWPRAPTLPAAPPICLQSCLVEQSSTLVLFAPPQVLAKGDKLVDGDVAKQMAALLKQMQVCGCGQAWLGWFFVDVLMC